MRRPRRPPFHHVHKKALTPVPLGGIGLAMLFATVMLRITAEDGAVGVERFRLEGRLSGDYVAEVSRFVDPLLDRPGRISLDLRGVTFVAALGAQLLRRLVTRNVEVHGCSTFVAHLLGLP